MRCRAVLLIGWVVIVVTGSAVAGAATARPGAANDVPVERLRAAADALAPRLVETRRDLHQHPELGNRETRTGALLADRLRALGLEVRYPVARTGVVAVLRGGRPGRVAALRADIDALPIQERNEVPYRSVVPGVKHACGHDAHSSIVLGVAEVLAGLRRELPGTVVFLFQPAEEGPPEGEEGGAPLVIKEGGLANPQVDAIFGLHVDPLMDVGTIGWCEGASYASSDRFGVLIQGKRTHGAYPHTGLDPIPVAADLINAFQALVAREIDARSPKVLTIGSIAGGNRFNIIADQVALEGTIRTLDEAVRADLKTRMQRTVDGIAAAHGTTAALRWVGEGNRATLNDAALMAAARPALERACGRDHVVKIDAQMGSEDFSYYEQVVPGIYLKLGVRNVSRGITAMIHTEDFDLDEAALPFGVRAMAAVVWDFLGAPAPKKAA
jgi:amidohydrolase